MREGCGSGMGSGISNRINTVGTVLYLKRISMC